MVAVPWKQHLKLPHKRRSYHMLGVRVCKCICKYSMMKTTQVWSRLHLERPRINVAYIWRSEDFQNVFWQSYVRSVYLLCPGDSALLILTNLHSSHYFHTCSQHYRRISNPSKWKSSMMFDRHLNTQQTFSCSKSTKKTRVKYSKRCE